MSTPPTQPVLAQPTTPASPAPAKPAAPAPVRPTRTDTKVRPTTGDGDHERFAHYLWGKNPKAMATEAMVTGQPVRALCGKLWVPNRDPSRYPVCPECKEIKARLQSGAGSGKSGDGGE